MIKFITLVPCGYQKDLPNKDIDLILLHKLIDNKEYLDYYENIYKGYKILDNSAFELGEGLDSELLLKYAEKIKANEIIIPDAYGDKDKTIKLFNDFEKKYLKKENFNYKIMVVPQGKDEKDYDKCLKYFINKKNINTIGINKLFKRNNSNKLSNLINEIKKNKKEIHFLGCNDILDYSMLALFSEEIRSADSRIISKYITEDSDVWECNLTPTQISDIKWLINRTKLNIK